MKHENLLKAGEAKFGYIPKRGSRVWFVNHTQ